MDGVANNLHTSRPLTKHEKKLQGPTTVAGGITVDASINVFRLVDVDTRLKRFTVIFGLTLHWADPRVKELDKELDEAQMSKHAWRPDMFITNVSEDPRLVDEHFTARRETGHCLWYQRIRATIDDHQFEMTDFPFDENDVEIMVRFPRHEMQNIREVTPIHSISVSF